MSPLKVETFNSDSSKWVQIGELGPNDPPGSLSSNFPDGRREIYQFSCSSDDFFSEIIRLSFGMDMKVGKFRVIDVESVKDAETVATLRRGDIPYRLTVKTDVSPKGRIIRFTHQ